jgi:hypothetical protein
MDMPRKPSNEGKWFVFTSAGISVISSTYLAYSFLIISKSYKANNDILLLGLQKTILPDAFSKNKTPADFPGLPDSKS